MDSRVRRIAVIWGKWGPYHLARFRALRDAGSNSGVVVTGVQYSAVSRDYAWSPLASKSEILTLNLGESEVDFRPLRIILGWLRFLYDYKPDVVFVPSYWNWSLLINFLSKISGARVVMMNESHAGTEKATGVRRLIKRAIIRGFDAGLVGGSPHRDYFAALGLCRNRIFKGYDAVDNDYFARRALESAADAIRLRRHHGLPAHYFLSLGRLVPKKNLRRLIEAYALFAQRHTIPGYSLVIAGGGEEESGLRAHAHEHGLKVAERSGPESSFGGATIYFPGFVQIDESPALYALADAFVLPSREEEWGLVVNEAMACGRPVLVSRTAGCAADLVQQGVNGFVFDSDNVAELARLLAVVASDRGLRLSMGENSRQIIRNWGCEAFAANALLAAECARS